MMIMCHTETPKFQSNGATVLERYKRYNMPEGNGGTQESANAIASTAYSLNPDQEDINSDKSLNELSLILIILFRSRKLRIIK